MVIYNNILIIQTAFIGDAILASSLAETLHAALPQARITILVRKGNEALYRNHPFLHDVMVWDKGEKKLKKLLHLLMKIRRARFDCVINCHRYLSSGILSAFSGAGHIAGFKENPLSFMFNHTARHTIGDGAHEIQRYKRLVDDLISASPLPPRLYPTAEDFESIRPLIGQPFVCMAPASVWFTKQLPVEKWTELCNRVDKKLNVYLLGSAGDDTLCRRITASSSHPAVQVLAGSLTFLQSAALMKNAVMNYVNDSAPLHIASSVNAPVTAFFCSTVPEFGFGPLSDVSEIKGVSDLPCRPCGLHGYKKCPLGHFKCGHDMPLPGAPAA